MNLGGSPPTFDSRKLSVKTVYRLSYKRVGTRHGVAFDSIVGFVMIPYFPRRHVSLFFTSQKGRQ